MHHTDTLLRIAEIARHGRDSRKPRAYLRQITELAEDEIDAANIAAFNAGSAEIRGLDGAVLRMLP